MTDKNTAATLVRAHLARLGMKNPTLSPEILAVCAVLDHFNALHWHDRDRYDRRIKELEARCQPKPGGVHEPERSRDDWA